MALTAMREHAAGASECRPLRDALGAARFAGDVELLQAIRDDQHLARQMQRTEVLRRKSRIRARLLSAAVRVNTNLVPNVARSLREIAARLGTDRPLEAYVFAQPDVHAFVCEADNRYLVALSSAAVNSLSADELEFVIGHELGHVAFAHLDVAVEPIVELGSVSLDQRKLLHAWQRASEISADRVGLLCCNSIEVAATALFKTISGLSLPGISIDPEEFAKQWDGLAEEILEQGVRDYWQLSHPLPPLRMRALLSFWSHRDQKTAERHIAHLLAHMDSRTDAPTRLHDRDPLLSRFSFWGGLYVALADCGPDGRVLAEFVEAAPPGVQIDELVRVSDAPSCARDLCMARFRQAKETRRQKLSSRELHSLIAEFIGVATRGGQPSERGIERVTDLGQELGIRAGAVHLLIDKCMNRS